MSLATVNFNGLVQGTPARSDDAKSTSRIFFDLIVHGRPRYNLYCDVIQTDHHSNSVDDLQVAEIVGYTGALDKNAFSSAVARYLRRHDKRSSYASADDGAAKRDVRVHVVMYSSSESFEIDQH